MNQPLAYIHPGAKIARNVVVEPFTTIHNNVTIGSGTWIGSNVTIMEGARIGSNCRIFPGAVISAIPQDLKFEGEDSLTVIGDNTTVRECVTINRGTSATGKTKIGSNCLIMATAHIAHDCEIGDNTIIVNGVALGGHVIVGNYAIIGGLAAVHQFIHIGDHAMISGGSLVRKDVPPYTKAAKEPLSYVGINSIGLRRRGFSIEKIREIQNIYRILYQKNFNTSQALEKIEAEMEATAERDDIITFIRNSQRGIMKGYSGN
ncbi:MAG: acyl-ACP--UDP-N-acetylglucosamine O-acyltransferase [Flavobacteriaceae bacterium]|jgi:UDP-N-acetylglucosamine acyltransferase|nr:acyl-ACP--UDP-N-acetylglucosamine O-acyltransferase [Flavobacteriaceae bacterium]